MTCPWPQVVLFGDSLFQCAIDLQDGFSFQAAIQSFVARRFDVVNRGLSGYNTSNALKLLPKIFTPPVEGGPRIHYLIILLGANDACLPMPTTAQNVPLETYKDNLTRIITHPAISAHSPKIFLVTPPPLDEIRAREVDLAAGHQGATRQSKVSAAYSEAVRQLAAEHPGTTLIDLYKALMEVAVAKTPGFDPSGPCLGDPASGQRGYLEHLLPDGLHLSGEAYRVFWDAVRPHLGSEWAGTGEEERVGYVLPDWKVAPWVDGQGPNP